MATVTNCDNCGVCCEGQNLLPLSGNMLDGWPLPPRLKEPLERLLKQELKGSACGDGTCVWFDPVSARCAHYEYRPSMCREFEVGGEDCLRMREHSSVAEGGDA
jgi:Fe-S-cluster containining protein